MALLNEAIRKDVGAMLADLVSPVTLKVFTQEMECQYCKETRELVEDVSSLSDKLSMEVYDFEADQAVADQFGIDKIPAIAVVGAKDYGIRLFGIPSGYEFGTLIEDIKLVSEGDSGLSPETRAVVAKLDKPVKIQVFITPTCPYCPRAVMLAHQLAVESDLIRGDMVEVVEFPHLGNKYQVMGVPRTVIDETIHIEGAVPEPMLMREFAKLLQ
ncbi:MAG: glutaredoxin [Chloroflexi bacterium HGW-Chloroflexi-1]|nr:MAG: glutaredoxin [Chloroflexi bacterium HGW-Chloroflexi-1]